MAATILLNCTQLAAACAAPAASSFDFLLASILVQASTLKHPHSNIHRQASASDSPTSLIHTSTRLRESIAMATPRTTRSASKVPMPVIESKSSEAYGAKGKANLRSQVGDNSTEFASAFASNRQASEADNTHEDEDDQESVRASRSRSQSPAGSEPRYRSKSRSISPDRMDTA